MRHIGNLPNENQAQKFVDFALTQDIRVNVEADNGEWAVWVYDEDHVDQAKIELEQFRQNPDADKYANAKHEADARREREIREFRETQKKVVRASESWNRSYWQRCPVTITLMALSVATVLMTTDPNHPLDFGQKIEPVRNWLTLAPIWERGGSHYSYMNPFEDVFKGQVWRLFTPMFLHFGIFHLLFNMMWLRDLGSVIEVRRGKWKFLLLVLVIAGISNAAQGLWSGPSFGGMSGVIFGLFGYIWMQSRYVPDSGFYISPNLVMLMLFWMVLCYTGILGGIANAAHTVGLLVGVLAGYAPKLWKDLSG